MKNKNTIFCKECKKEIDLHNNTVVKKNARWDLYCTSCYSWLGGMKDLLGWEIDESNEVNRKSENKTMDRG